MFCWHVALECFMVILYIVPWTLCLLLATFWWNLILYYIVLSAYIAGCQLDCHFIGASAYTSIFIVDLNLTIL